MTRYRGSEGLSQLYRFGIELVSEDPTTTLGDIVGKSAVLTISTPYGDRRIHGVVARMAYVGETEDATYLQADLMPRLWLLAHRYQSRIFQGQTVLEIVADVLARAGLPQDYLDTSNLQAGEYSRREYCVQYRETDFNFISRLLEEAGIFYYFEQGETEHQWVLLDSKLVYAAIKGEPEIPYHTPTGMNVSEEHVVRVRVSEEVRPGAMALNDYSFKNPSLHLQTTRNAERDLGLEFSDYPGGFATKSEGEKIAALRTEEFEAGRRTAVGQSSCHRLSPGKTFSLVEHPNPAFNREYLVTRVTVQGKQVTTRALAGTGAPGADNETTSDRASARWLFYGGEVSSNTAAIALALGVDPIDALAMPNLLDDGPNHKMSTERPTFECRFESIPSEVVYRPPRITPRPRVHGTQTARVVGPEGEEIQTDEYGRVRGQFDWDREGNERGQPKLHGAESSCWIRVSQAMAGGGYGTMFLPRVGQEVVVDFLEGNPDRPIIIGRVYNADQKPPYDLPAEKTKSVIKSSSSLGGGGSNEIRFEDLKDREQLLLFAQKDLHIRANNDRIEIIDHDRHLTVKENKYELVGKSRHEEVRLDLRQSVGGNVHITVKGDVGQEIKGNHSETVTGDCFLKGKNIVLEAGEALTLKAGGNFVRIDSSGITILGTKVDINCTGGSAGIGTAVELAGVAAPGMADTVLPGRDVRYAGAAERVEGEAAPDVASVPAEPAATQQDTSWIEIELVNEAGQPVPGEAYQITGPDGETIREGHLDQNGQAHVTIPEPGNCQICFPNLDADA